MTVKSAVNYFGQAVQPCHVYHTISGSFLSVYTSSHHLSLALLGTLRIRLTCQVHPHVRPLPSRICSRWIRRHNSPSRDHCFAPVEYRVHTGCSYTYGGCRVYFTSSGHWGTSVFTRTGCGTRRYAAGEVDTSLPLCWCVWVWVCLLSLMCPSPVLNPGQRMCILTEEQDRSWVGDVQDLFF
jgi:hypothetical protein